MRSIQTVVFLISLGLFCSLKTLKKKSTLPKYCWRDVVSRKEFLDPICPKGSERVGIFCFEKCPAGMKRVGFHCHSVCPSGFRDDGLYCRLAEYSRGAGYPWKPRDGFSNPDNGMFERCEKDHGVGNCEKYLAIVYPKCKAGFKNFGCCVCRPEEKPDCEALGLNKGIDLSCGKKIVHGIIRKSHCLEDEEKQFGVCWKKCAEGYTGIGDFCVADVPEGYMKCGFGASPRPADCREARRYKIVQTIEKLVEIIDYSDHVAEDTNDAFYKKMRKIHTELKELHKNFKDAEELKDLEEFIDNVQKFLIERKTDETTVDLIIKNASDVLSFFAHSVTDTAKKHFGIPKCSSI